MKTLISLFFVLLFVSLTYSQTVSVTTTSVSALGVGMYDKDGNYTGSDLTVRGAIEPKITFYEGGSFSMRAVYNTNEKNIIQYWYDQQITSSASLRFGYSARPIGFLNRPNPATAGGHFETSGTNMIPASATGVTLSKKINESISLYQGVYYNQQKKLPEISIGSSLRGISNEIKGGVFLNKEQWGVATTIKNSAFSVTGYYESEKIVSGCLEIYTPIIDPYFVINYDRKRNIKNDMEFGFTKSFSLDSFQRGMNYLFGAGYNAISKTGNVYFWVYI